jgi:hypothetical protein
LNKIKNKEMSVSFSNTTQHMSKSAHGHPSSFQSPQTTLVSDNDIERRIQAFAAKDGIRVQEFFIDFDKLRKGTCGEAAVSYNFCTDSTYTVPHMSWYT